MMTCQTYTTITTQRLRTGNMQTVQTAKHRRYSGYDSTPFQATQFRPRLWSQATPFEAYSKSSFQASQFETMRRPKRGTTEEEALGRRFYWTTVSLRTARLGLSGDSPGSRQRGWHRGEYPDPKKTEERCSLFHHTESTNHQSYFSRHFPPSPPAILQQG